MSNVTSLTYFATDGNYGNAGGLTVVDTSAWTDLDFELLDGVRDELRPTAGRTISDWIEGGRTDDYNTYFQKLGIDIP
jgi:hypothetical protein